MIMKKLLITVILLMTYSVHPQTDEKETLKQLNQEVLELYRNQKFEKALKLAQQAINLSIKIYGAEHPETAAAYVNLGVMYQEGKKYKEAIENLQKAVNIYQKVSDLKSEKLVMTYQILAYSQFLDNQQEESEANYLKAIETAENKFGKNSKESFMPTLNLANIYARLKKFEKADEFYLKSFALAIKNFGKQSQEVEQIEDSRGCLVSSRNYSSESAEAFHNAQIKLFGESEEYGAKIINGKAVSLPKPPYPLEAKSKRIGGSVSVRVKIDEQGNVTEARVACGNPILGRAAVQSAWGAKFVPTLANGKPIKVSGYIIYNFVP